MPNSNESAAPTSLSIRRFLQITMWCFRMYWRVDKFALVTNIVTSTVLSLQFLIYGYIFAKIIDMLIAASSAGTAQISDLYPWLALIFVYNSLEGLLRSIDNYSRQVLRFKSNRLLDQYLYRHLNYLGIQTLEEPAAANRIKRAEQNMHLLWPFLEEINYLTSDIANIILAGLVLLSFLPIMVPVLLIIAVARFIPNRYFTKQDFRFQFDTSEVKRKANWDMAFLKSPRDLLEVKINGAYNFFDNRYSKFVDWYNGFLLGLRLKQQGVAYIFRLVDSIVSVAGYYFIFAELLRGAVTVGTVTFQIRGLSQFSGSVSAALNRFSGAYEFAIQLNDVLMLFETEPAFKDGTIELPRFNEPPALKFVDASFKYPGSEKLVYQNLNLEIKSGERVAIVGHNGAGKTTLVKLLARIYDVTTGELCINEHNIKDLKLDDWYKNIGILFQEYNFYEHLTAAENIYLGRPSKPRDDKKIEMSAEMADADFIKEYPKGLEQIMSERFKEGIRPSTGQKQKLAIARFFYRNAPLVIFDEPTSAIDAVSEYNIFNRIYEFFSGKTVIIISHRFSTVRNADRIIVVDHGQVVEQGTHEELMQLNGTYANAFRLQAEGYASS
jgi:ATP-binding cassette subfamily B protein